MPMTFEETIVTDIDGKSHNARVALCSCDTDARSGAWFVFQVEGQTHLHLQCTQCETSYCPVGCSKGH